MSYSSANTISTVARREIKVALRSKGLIITVGLILAVVIAGPLLLSLFGDEGDEPARIGVIGVESSELDATTQALTGGSETVTEPMSGSREDAITRVQNADPEAVLIRTNEGFELITDGDPSPQVMGSASAIASSVAQREALDTLGVSPQEFAEAMPPAVMETTDVSTQEEGSGEETAAAVVSALIGASVMAVFIMTFAGNIGARVTEEKSSRVVEIILSTVRPMDFLAGKIVGNTLYGLAATVLVLGAGIASLTLNGLLDGFPVDGGSLGLTVLSFVLGMLLFGSLYAAAGSMVSRSEDLASTQTPVLLLLFGMLYAPVFGVGSLDSTLMQVLTWVPPFSLTLIPLQVAVGNMSYAVAGADYVLTTVVIVLLIFVVSKIYRRSILLNGKKMSWSGALRSKA